MTAAATSHLMTVPEFLNWVPEGEKWELVGGLPIQMMAESDLHETIKTNVAGALTRRLRPPSDCRPAVDGRQVMIDDTTSYRPDAYVNCAPFSSNPMDQVAEAPTVIFEVSVTTLDRDTMEKRANYFRHPTVSHVVVIDAIKRRATLYTSEEAVTLTVNDTLRIDGRVVLDIPVAEFFEFLPPVSE